MADSKDGSKFSLETLLQVIVHSDDEERKDFVQKNRPKVTLLVKTLISLAWSDEKDGAKEASLCLAKLSEFSDGVELLVDSLGILKESLKKVIDALDSISDVDVVVLKSHLILWVNLTRHDNFTEKSANEILDSGVIRGLNSCIENLDNFKDQDYTLHILNLVLNVSRFETFIELSKQMEKRLEKLTKALVNSFENSKCVQTRQIILAIIVNLLLTGESQSTILDYELELVPKLLFPLAGPTEILYDDEDMAQLPLDIQFLPPDTQRENDETIRDSLISCFLLCSNTKDGRKALNKNGVYLVLRELHKWETNKGIKKRIEDVVDILIKDEIEYVEHPDLLKVVIPDDLLPKLEEIDRELLI